MNSMTCNVHLVQVTPAGNVTLNDCGAPNAAVCSSMPSARIGSVGVASTVVEPHALLPAVTGGSAGSSSWLLASATR